MEMVAASKMRHSQSQALSSRPYTESLRKVLFSLLASRSKIDHPLMKESKSSKTAIILVSTNKGLCGGLNTNHFRYLLDFASQFDPEKLEFLVVGRKGEEFLVKSQFNIIADFPQIKEKISFEQSLSLSHFIIKHFLEKKIGKAFMSFSDFVSTLSQKPKIVQILPVSLKDISQQLGLLEKTEKESFLNKEYLIEPGVKEISDWLLPYFIELEVYHYLLEAKAAEHSARMVAMKNASENAEEILNELTMEFNKARQAQITTQIAEVATAALSIQE